MPTQNPVVVRNVLVVSSERKLAGDVRSAVVPLGGVWSVQQMDSLRLAVGFVGQVDVTIVYTMLSWRTQYLDTLLGFVKTFNAKGSAVFVICPIQDQEFVAQVKAAGAKNIIYEGYDVDLLRRVLASVPVAKCVG